MRYLALIGADGMRIMRIRVGSRPVLRVGPRVYRADESLYLRDKQGSDAMLIYDEDGTQPHGHGMYCDPDIVRVYIDSAKLTGAKKIATDLGGIIEAVGHTILPISIAAIILIGVLTSVVRCCAPSRRGPHTGKGRRTSRCR